MNLSLVNLEGDLKEGVTGFGGVHETGLETVQENGYSPSLSWCSLPCLTISLMLGSDGLRTWISGGLLWRNGSFQLQKVFQDEHSSPFLILSHHSTRRNEMMYQISDVEENTMGILTMALMLCLPSISSLTPKERGSSMPLF